MADSNQSWKRDGEEEEEEDLDETKYIAQKDAVLFAIDVSDTMLAPPPPSDARNAETDSPTAAAIKCAYQIMQQRIISSPKDMMGVLLFGTEESKFQEDDSNARGGPTYPHCYLLSDLNIPAAEDVRVLKGIIENEDQAQALLVPTNEPVVMSNLLFCANQIFTTRAPNFGSRRLFIITDKDDPHAGDKSARSQAAVRAKDLYDLGVTIELFPISHTDHEFDRSKFYDDIIYRDPAEEGGSGLNPSNFKSSGDGISLLNNLISDINSKQVAKRALFSNLPFEIGPSFKISVKGYNLLQKQAPARSCYVWLDGEEPQIAVGESAQMEEDTTRKVEKVEIKKAYKFGGAQVLFTPEEQKELKDFGSPGLRIIGFKPQSMLPFWASVKKSTFIYPSEEDYIGSTRVFSALWKKLLDGKKMGLAWYIARSNATPQIVAILPSQERVNENTNAQNVPAGLWLYPLPFADDIRPPPETPSPLVSPDNVIDEMRKVIGQLQLPKAVYDPSKYPNPSLQWHYRILQSMALNDTIPENPEDKTIPRFRQINKRCGEYIHTWGKVLEEECRKVANQRRTKHELDVSEEPPKKRARNTSAQTLEGMSHDDLKKACIWLMLVIMDDSNAALKHRISGWKAPPFSRTSSANTTITSRNFAQTSPRPAHATLNRRSLSPKPARPVSTIEAPNRSPLAAALSSPDASSSESSSDSEAPAQSRLIRRPPRFAAKKLGQSEDGDEDDDEPAFMPFATGEPSHHDPSATLRGDLRTIGRRLPAHKKSMEVAQQSQTSDSSASSTAAAARRPDPLPKEGSHRQRLAGPLSPRRTAELAGRSPISKGKGREGSDGTPSMGSSFSDLDDASVTQSALEEALASNMQAGGGMASRMSSISQALRSKYL
ncbi:hypothetical protein G7Y89_g3791 [Cudoniella acicularis]|uniref:ATP-dependent DNA helicase II subunit 1 n=1 Tax=Cudoniella acicularis TaxID=354080 RepID=A0A8H4RSQ8_9HELO|nr:hypothetical protein G7Y89_g3791 [Cudoniella acicularis]